jgi:hypothetical protein
VSDPARVPTGTATVAPADRRSWALPVITELTARFDAAGLRWLLLREPSDDAGDVDLIVDAADRGQAELLLDELGWVALTCVGRGSHRHHLILDRQAGRFVKLDVVSRIEFGRYQELRTHWADGCLERRQRTDGPWRPDPADAFWLRALHLLLDRGETPVHAQLELTAQATTGLVDTPLAEEVSRVLPRGWSAAALLERIRDGDWPALEPLREPSRWRSGAAMSVSLRRYRHRLTRRLARPVLRRRQRLTAALLGPDGAGKSTLSRLPLPGWPFAVAVGYGGLYPLDAPPRRLPPAVRFAARLLSAHRRISAARSTGGITLIDRHPYDLIVLDGTSSRTKRRLQRGLIRVVSPRPDLVVTLDAPGTVLHARSGEHSAETLEHQRVAYQGFVRACAGRGIPTCALDATSTTAELQRGLLEAVWSAWSRPRGHRRGGRA